MTTTDLNNSVRFWKSVFFIVGVGLAGAAYLWAVSTYANGALETLKPKQTCFYGSDVGMQVLLLGDLQPYQGRVSSVCITADDNG